MRGRRRPRRPDARGDGAASDWAGNHKSRTSLADDLATVARHHGLTGYPNHENSFWLRSRLIDIETLAQAGTLPQCGHLGATSRAGVSLWGMTALCPDCLHLDRLTGPADRACDRCGHVCERGIHVGVVAHGPFVVSFGLCPSCSRREVGA